MLKFIHESGKIFAVIQEDGWEDVTDKIMPVVDDYLDFMLGLNERSDSIG